MQSKVETLEKQVLNAKHPVLPPTPDNPFADTLDPSEIDKRVASAENARQWLIDNPEGGEIETGNGNTLELDAKDVSRRLADLNNVIDKHAPARKEFLQQREHFQREVKNRYPAMLKEGSQMVQYAAGIANENPGIMNLPDGNLIIGDSYVGALVRNGQYRLVPVKKDQAEEKSKQPAVAKKRAATPPPAPQPSAPSRKSPTPDSAASRQKAVDSGKREDVADYLMGAGIVS